MRDRGFRLHQERKRKRKIRKRLEDRMWKAEPTDRDVGVQYSVHDADCSCPMCGNPRRHLSQRTLKEQSADESYNEQMLKEQEDEDSFNNIDDPSDCTVDHDY